MPDTGEICIGKRENIPADSIRKSKKVQLLIIGNLKRSVGMNRRVKKVDLGATVTGRSRSFTHGITGLATLLGTAGIHNAFSSRLRCPCPAKALIRGHDPTDSQPAANNQSQNVLSNYLHVPITF